MNGKNTGFRWKNMYNLSLKYDSGAVESPEEA
jgi:hypothetical protein